MRDLRKVIVIGLDGLDPAIAAPLLDAGELPHLDGLRRTGGFWRVRTTIPAQTPVAWSSFATGTNPGGHGIFDFIRRDPLTYLPDFSLNRYEQKNAFVPPRAVNLRRGTTLWELLTAAGIPSTVIRCPCTFPPDELRGRMLSGMGVPDLRGGLGTSTFYTTAPGVRPLESENVVQLAPPDADGTIATHVIGPRSPKTRADLRFDLRVRVEPGGGRATLLSDGQPRLLEVREGQWSDWLKVKFKAGLLQSVTGIVRFHLVRTTPTLELYASPVNFDPTSPLFPISQPGRYAAELAERLGTFYTTGMVEDHNGLSNGRFGEEAYLDQCAIVLREREAMMAHELDRFEAGFFFCLFDTPDRVQHMFWRFREPGHPANDGDEPGPDLARVIEEHYRTCDAIVGRALARADDRTLFVAMSDHGFGSFQRGVHLNTWLHENGFLALRDGLRPSDEAGDFLRSVDWGRTRAYALGLGSLYLNLRGREGEGLVDPADAAGVKAEIARGLTGIVDPGRGVQAVRGVLAREQAYAGAYAEESPDLVVNFSSGYRASWSTGLGGVPEGVFEDNVKKWGGDHIVDPALVSGVLFANRPLRGEGARLVDLAPTVLAALGVPKGPVMEGESLLP